MTSRPQAWTPGDPAGIGPELLLRALEETPNADVVLYGDPAFWRACAEDLAERGVLRSAGVGLLRPWLGDTPPVAGQGPWARPLAVAGPPQGWCPWPWGRAEAWCGTWQHAALLQAIDDAMAERVSGIVTAPWHKARLADAGLPPTGHTEVLAARTGTPDVVMMLAGDRLRVALATVHIPLAEVASTLTPEGLERTLDVTAAALKRDFGIASPRLAVCGLNPHAGEGGLLGTEERDWIAPLLERCRARGLDVTGPWPADTLFPRVVAGHHACDVVVALYHDQGLVPLKTVHFGEAANITLGMPILRTSVDHGTAYDIAGTGSADLGSFRVAVRAAKEMAARRAGDQGA